ncbi:hypothetical protein B0T16DRAFT_171165 [Cercophora newfieldiana]|uniref:Uncharacterized protein n=1 Tax=Cercophora newfieldiana TaxID=92897 RepID=A0AA39Y6H5_9PEZI|nr:hypothetical protein B0T16DRAFT_171165 [Cercophora newfieldiana]
MDWIEALMDTIKSEWDGDGPLPNALQRELWHDQLHDPAYMAVHGRFMKPLCRAIPGSDLGKPGSLVAYMPYIHWELDGNRLEMNSVIKSASELLQIDWGRVEDAVKEKFKRQIRKRRRHPKTESQVGKKKTAEEKNPNAALLEQNLFPVSPMFPVHIRRALDQFQYYMTENTEERDGDQVISRYFQRCHPTKAVPIMMVDQLWLWVLDESEFNSRPPATTSH